MSTYTLVFITVPPYAWPGSFVCSKNPIPTLKFWLLYKHSCSSNGDYNWSINHFVNAIIMKALKINPSSASRYVQEAQQKTQKDSGPNHIFDHWWIKPAFILQFRLHQQICHLSYSQLPGCHWLTQLWFMCTHCTSGYCHTQGNLLTFWSPDVKCTNIVQFSVPLARTHAQTHAHTRTCVPYE